MNPSEGGCASCSGIGFRYLVRDGRNIVQRCVCQARPRFDIASPDDRLAACQIPPAHHSHTLGNFELRTPTLRKAYEKALAYCHDFQSKAPVRGHGLLFWGPNQTGKTHLAVAVLTEIVATHRVTGRMWNFATLLKEIGRSYDKTSLTTDLRPLRSALKADILLLDDLASRRMPDWGYNTLFEIIDARYRECRPTLITTMYEDVDRATALTDDAREVEEYLIERVGIRIRSRLLEMCVFIPTLSLEERDALRKPRRPTTLRGLRRGSSVS